EMLENAQISYTRAHAVASVLGMPHISCDANAGLASVALARGDSAAAMEPAEQIIGYLESQSLNGCEDPAGVALVGYRALLAANDSRALPVLQSSYRLLQQRARTLPEDQRGRYLEATAERRELCALVDGISVAYP